MESRHIHFMGIGGSGASSIASIAHSLGFIVSGCDQKESQYTANLEKKGVDIKYSHDENHLEGVDILAITPAILWQNNKHPEYLLAKKRGIVMTWEELMGIILQKDKYVLAVAGTHGKSTTTGLLGEVMITAGLDPICEVGAVVPEWGANFRVGKSKFFLCEADEFNDNFLNYHPDIAIITSVEFDHPEYFKKYPRMISSYKKFIKNIKKNGTLIIGVGQGAEVLIPFVNKEHINLKTYSIDRPSDYMAYPIVSENGRTVFSINSSKNNYILKIPGNHNVRNALSVFAAAKVLNIDEKVVKKVFAQFGGAGRRFELMGEVDGVRIYNDYAHHPTAVEATLEGVKKRFPNNKIWVIFQPHTYSRTEALLPQFVKCFDLADKVIITEIFASRESGKQTITTEEFVSKIKHPSVIYIKSFEDIAKHLKDNTQKGDIIINMGAGDNYKITNFFLNSNGQN